jgi:hypothetical protein
MSVHRKSSPRRRSITVSAAAVIAGGMLFVGPAAMAFADTAPATTPDKAIGTVGNNINKFVGTLGTNANKFVGKLGTNTGKLVGTAGTNGEQFLGKLGTNTLVFAGTLGNNLVGNPPSTGGSFQTNTGG